MQEIAASDGTSWRIVAPNTRAVRPNGMPRKGATRKVATTTAVPGSETKLRSSTAASGVGFGATGGTFCTWLCSTGSGTFRAGDFR